MESRIGDNDTLKYNETVNRLKKLEGYITRLENKLEKKQITLEEERAQLKSHGKEKLNEALKTLNLNTLKTNKTTGA
jgi:TPP-dependent pyruvate/acetoin dehydrogenase alpha subunit